MQEQYLHIRLYHVHQMIHRLPGVIQPHLSPCMASGLPIERSGALCGNSWMELCSFMCPRPCEEHALCVERQVGDRLSWRQRPIIAGWTIPQDWHLKQVVDGRMWDSSWMIQGNA